MLAAEEMYDVLVTTPNTKSEVNIWRQTSNDHKFLVVLQYLCMILATPQRCTTVQCGLFWRGGRGIICIQMICAINGAFP